MTIYLLCHEADIPKRDELKKFLETLESKGVSLLTDDDLPFGEDKFQARLNALNNALLVFPLLSSDFLADDQMRELGISISKKEPGKVVPVLVSHCGWLDTPYSEMECLPSNKNYLVTFSQQTKGLELVYEGARIVVNKRLGQLGKAKLFDDVRPVGHDHATAELVIDSVVSQQKNSLGLYKGLAFSMPSVGTGIVGMSQFIPGIDDISLPLTFCGLFVAVLGIYPIWEIVKRKEKLQAMESLRLLLRNGRLDGNQQFINDLINRTLFQA